MFNLAGSAKVSVFSGMAGLADTMTLNPGILLMALAAWAMVPLALAAFVFSRREL
jgi:Cu-processing system permease protein